MRTPPLNFLRLVLNSLLKLAKRLNRTQTPHQYILKINGHEIGFIQGIQQELKRGRERDRVARTFNNSQSRIEIVKSQASGISTTQSAYCLLPRFNLASLSSSSSIEPFFFPFVRETTNYLLFFFLMMMAGNLILPE